MSFKKPTELLRQANAAIHAKTGIAPFGAERPRHTDTMEFLAASVLIGYKKRPGEDYPTDAMKAAAVQGAKTAQSAIAKANDILFKVSALRQDEPAILTQVLESHFGLTTNATDLGDGLLSSNKKNKSFALTDLGKHDRRWVIEKIRQRFLHLSFHLNTGVYLIDLDASNRTTQGKQAFSAADNQNTEANVFGYTGSNSRSCGFRNGEIHINFAATQTYSSLSYARIIIHEAVHKYLEIADLEYSVTEGDGSIANHSAYAHDNVYHSQSLQYRLINADCYAWAAVSLYAGRVLMGSTAAYNTDWMQASK